MRYTLKHIPKDIFSINISLPCRILKLPIIMNKNCLVAILVVVQFAWCTYARPSPQEIEADIDDDIGIAVDLETLKSYADGTWKEKYDDNYEGYDVKQKHNCDEHDSNDGCHYNRESSVGSDAFGHKSKSKAVFGAGYEHENQVVYGTEIEHEGAVLLGETKIKYGGEASSSASYDETKLGGSIGPKVSGSASATAFGVGAGASIEVGMAAEGGINSHEKNVGLKAVTPAGAYGAKIGCKTEVCFIGCVSVTFC